MSNRVFKPDEWVLVYSGEGGYTPRKIVSVNGDELMISFGVYQTRYNENSVHKCPKTLVPTEEQSNDKDA